MSNEASGDLTVIDPVTNLMTVGTYADVEAMLHAVEARNLGRGCAHDVGASSRPLL